MQKVKKAAAQLDSRAAISVLNNLKNNQIVVELGKKEIYKRVQALGYEVTKISDFDYIKYDCIEWMQSHELKITVQRSGEWLQVVEKHAHVHPVTLFCDYQAGEYITCYH